MTENDEKLITSFFEDSRHHTLPDNGFSERVMRSLPENNYARMKCLGRWWTATCVVAGILFFFLSDGFGHIKKIVYDVLMDIISVCVSVEFNINTLATVVVLFISITLVAIYTMFTYSDYDKTLI